MTVQSDGTQEHFAVRATAESHFAWLRTRLSLERTLMACIRTATALIGFGFTIVQFFAHFRATEGVAPALLPGAPRYLGLSLILTGVLVMVVAVHQYRSLISHLWSGDFKVLTGIDKAPYKSAQLWVAVLLMVIGAFVFVSVLLGLS